MSTHAQTQAQIHETNSEADEVGTVRDKVYVQIIKQHVESGRIRWTTEEMVAAIDEDISDDTVRDAFESWVDEELLRHTKWSPYWYLEPEWF